LVESAEIIASRSSAEEMEEVPASLLDGMMQAAPNMGELGDYLTRIFGPFDFSGIRTTLPSRTFERELSLKVGDKAVELIEVGPAHTRGDVLVHVPADRTVFTGDILFVEGHPIIWAGPVENWIRACERLMAMDVETIVPGHGPLTDKRGVAAVRDYLAYIAAEARKRYDAGMPAFEAAQDIAMDDYDSWGDGERIAVNVNTLYREFSGDTSPVDIAALFGQMAQLAKR
jgi:glyoxylase-like metal-dependent hydrolase (beta-lactamase superfamily II)